MKYVITLVVFISFFYVVDAQSNINPKKNFDQKKFLDSLQKAFRQPAIQIDAQPLLVYNTPVAPFKNEGEEVGMSGEDTIYRMKTDNMRVLKPNTKKTYIPNAAEGKIFMMPPAKHNP